jgi:hypothetical protein
MPLLSRRPILPDCASYPHRGKAQITQKKILEDYMRYLLEMSNLQGYRCSRVAASQ